MVDRISTYWRFNQPINDMMNLQADISKTSAQISSGSRILTAADDPVGSARVLQLDQEIALMSQYEKNIILLDARLEQEDGVLKGLTDTVQRIRELTVQAGNSAVYSPQDLKAIEAEIKERLNEVFDLANSKDGSGEYLFSGFQGQTAAFVNQEGGGYRYQGDEGVRNLQVSRTITLASSDSGKDIFVNIPAHVPSFSSYASESNSANPPAVISQGVTVDQDALNEFFPEDAVITFENELDISPPGKNFTVRRKSDGRVVEGLSQVPFSPGQEISFGGMSVRIAGSPKAGDQFIVETSNTQNLMVTVEKLSYALEHYGSSPEFADLYNDAIFNTLENLDNSIETISQVRARIGARLNTAENTGEQHADNKLAALEVRSEISDLDYAEAVSRLQLEEFVLQATQQTFASTSRLSLFDFI